MPVPLTPEPSGHASSLRRSSAPPSGGAPSSHNGRTAPVTPNAPKDTTAIIDQVIKQAPADEDSPTIISSARNKHPSPDVQHAESLVGRKLGHYQLIESVGVGGMAAVIKAIDEDLNRVVALKILPPDMATDPENINRFRQEARAAARLDHENVARVYNCGEDQGLHFIAFEFVEGENLRVLMEGRGGLLPVAESLHYMIQVTAGLSHAASRGVVHRDIKPSNIIITPEGKAKIVDMGLARNLDSRASNGQLTQSGVTLGTFDYISPEQAIEPRSADCRSDIYSLGCTFYHVLTGRAPVPEGTAAKKLHCHQHVAPLDPRELNTAIPDELAAILGKMMAKDLNQRYQHPDHLLQHLLIVARKLDLPAGVVFAETGHHISPYVDQPLPEAPGLSPLWIGLAVVGLVLSLFAISGGFDGSKQPLERQSFWQSDNAPRDTTKGPNTPKDLPNNNGTDVPPAAKGPREARTTSEFIAFLRHPDTHIKLKAGIVYDLTRVSRKDATLAQALFEGSELAIEGDRLDPPTIRLFMAPADDGKTARLGAMTIRGPSDGSSARVRFRGIHFEFIADDPEPGQTGISLLNVDQIDMEECTFVPPLRKGDPIDGPAAIAVSQPLAKETMPEIRFDRCYFAPGSVAVQIVKSGPQLFRATECAFAPQFAIVRVQAHPAGEEERKPAEIRFESCSMLMSSGAVIEIGDQVPCKVAAGWCLFSNPELPEMEPSKAFVVRQVGVIAAETRFDGAKSADMLPVALPNGYQNVLAFINGELSLTFDDCKREQVPVEDAAGRLLTKNPWADEHPLKRLFDSPRQIKQAFTVDLKQEILRLEPDKNRNLLGTKNLPGTKVYDYSPFESPVPEVKLAANQKVWQPDYPAADDAKLPKNVYRSLVKAIVDLKKGDVLLIRHNGPLEMDPVEFKEAETDITIRPDASYRPELIPRVPKLKKDHALFKLYGGQIVFENLLFRLKADRAPAIVSMPGGGQCTFRNCCATLEEGDDLSVVSLADPRGEMMMMGMATPEKWPVPRIVIENTFIRGRGRALSVHGSRAFDLKVKNTLAVLDGSLIGVEPSPVDISESGPAQVSLDHVTTYLTKHLLSQKANEKRTENKGLGLVQVPIHATHCLFVPAAESAALVSLERIESLDQIDTLFQWKDGKQNVYGFKSDQVMLQIIPENSDTAARLERIERDRWLAKWREADAAFADVNFSIVSATRRFDGVKPGDFELKSINPPLKDGLPDVGAQIEVLRKVFAGAN